MTAHITVNLLVSIVMIELRERFKLDSRNSMYLGVIGACLAISITKNMPW